jgi:hypothetical protein
MNYCVLNYSSKLNPDGQQSYDFLFCHYTIRVISIDGRPFSRGDIVKIVKVDNGDGESQSAAIYVDIIGDPIIDKMPTEIEKLQEIPTLLFIRTKIFLDEESNYVFEESDNVEVLLAFSTTLDSNRVYTLAVLVKGETAILRATDDATQTEFEWLICDCSTNDQRQ